MAEAGFYSAPMGPAGPKKKLEKVPKTMRFSVQLSDSDELSCPEFSWLKLLREAAENDEQKMLECLDPFAAKDLEEQKKLEALARTFEEKYKNYNAGKKKKKIKFQDLLDVGDGYDETDPFVDNSEAYDELVPETLTTKLGGFYINSGQLDFKELPVERGEDEAGAEGEEEPVVKKKKRKLTIESDSEEESSSASEMIKKKKKLFKKALKEAAKSSDSDAAGPKKPNKLSKQDKKRVFTGNMLLKRQKLEKAKKLKKAALDTRTPTKIPKKPQENGVPKPNLLHGNKLAETMDDTFAEVLGYTKPESPAKSVTGISVTPKSSPLKNGDVENGEKLGPESAPALPEMIPSMKSAVEEIKQTARACKDGKQKFFNDEVNRLLLNIELGSRQHTCSQRSTIYQHLAAFLPCSKETLLKRAKKLRESDHGDKLKDPKERLRQAIERVMPDQIERYEQRVKAASAARSEELKELKETTKDVSAAGKEEGSTPDSEEEEKSGEDKKKVNMPRRRFNWTPEIRRLLCELVEAKMSLLETSKNKTQTAEEYLKSYLDTEIRQLWPKGWMQTRMLYKESKPAHGPWTSGKMKKTPAITKVTATTCPNSNSNSKPKTEPRTEVKNEDDIFDFPEDEFGDAKPEVDVSSMLSSFLDSEVLSLTKMDKMDNVKTKPVTKPKEKQREEVPKSKDVPKQSKAMPPPKGTMSEHSFMAQFEKFMKQTTDEKRSPEKPTNSFSAPTMSMASPSRSPVHSGGGNPLNLSSSASQSPRDESSKKYFQTPPETIDLRTPPRVQHNTAPSALSPPVVRDMLSPSGPVSDYMNSFAKFAQQQQQKQQQQQQHSPTKSPQLTPPKRIWSPASNPVSYSSPQNMTQAQNYTQQKIQQDGRSSIGGTMSTGNGLGTGSSHNMATGNHNMSGSSMQTGSGRMSSGSGLQAGSSPMATPLSGSPRDRSMYGMYSTEQYRQQYLEQQAAQAAAAMAANAMKGSPSMYGLPASAGMGFHSPQHAPLSPQGLFPGHRSPSASPQRHPMLQQHARHPYSQYAQDKQPRPY